MQDILTEILTILRGIWRYRWYAMGVAWLVAIIGWTAVGRLPDQYVASARVFVDTDSILRPLLKGLAIHTNVTERLTMMTRTLLSRPNLEKVARNADMDINAIGTQGMEDMINDLATGIRLTSTRRENLYHIGYQNENPVLAKKVVQATLNMMIESTLGESREDTNVAQLFIDDQIEEYENRLLDAENRLKEFKRKNQGLMAASGETYFQRLELAQGQLSEAQLALREAEQRLGTLRRQIQGEEPVFGFGAIPQYSGSDGQTDPRVQALEMQKEELLLRFTEKHPDVMALQTSIDAIIQQKGNEIQEPTVQVQPTSPELETNPVYQQLKITIGETEAEVASLKVRVSEYRARVAKLKQLINTVPEIEAQFTRLNRDYAIHKGNYDDLVARRETARISEDIEQTGEDVRFKVVDPPHVPPTPSGPDRLLLSSVVLVSGLGLGVALAFLLSQLRPFVYDSKSLRNITGLPVFATVTRIWTPELLLRRRMEFGAFLLVGMVLLMAFGGVLILYSGGNSGQMFQALRGLL